MSWIDRLMGRPDAPVDYDRLMRQRVPDLSLPVRSASRANSAPLVVTATADAADYDCGCSDSGGGSCAD